MSEEDGAGSASLVRLMGRSVKVGRRGLVLLSSLVLTIGALSPAAALGEAGEAGGPARGIVWGTGTFTPTEPGAFTGVSTGSGFVSNIGRVTVRGEQTQDATGAYTGTFTTTARNGDTITGTFSGAVRPTPNPRIFKFRHTGTNTGGTGRFAGATGSFTVTGFTVVVSVDSTTGVTRTRFVAVSVGP